MSAINIGCCGAYCKTCPEFQKGACQGCKLGYARGKRDLKKARCKMKVCCMGKGLSTCADCEQYATCDMLQAFYGKKGYKYRKYQEATLFIRQEGYGRFLGIANDWRRQYGKFP